MSNPAPGRRQRRREEKTERLLKTAMEMIVESGFDGLTMPGLAERADVAVGGLYRYFKGKQDLIAALQIRAIGELDAYIDARRTSRGLAALRETVAGVQGFSQENATAFALLESAIADPRRLLDDVAAEKVNEALLPVLEGVAQCVIDATDDGEIASGHPMRRTLALWGVVFGCLHFRKRDGRIPDKALHSSEILSSASDALFAGWLNPRP